MGRTWRAGLVALAIALTASTAMAQTPALKTVMRDKLAHSQVLLGAMVTSQWRVLEERSAALKRLTTRPAWMVLQSPEYVRETARFVQSLDAVAAAARRKDLDETLAAYTAMTASCVQCHRQVARMRLATGAGR